MNHEERSGKQQEQPTFQTFPPAMDGINGWDYSPSHAKTLCSPLLPSKVQKHDYNLGEETERAACDANRKKNPPTLFGKYSSELQKEMTSSEHRFHIYNPAAAHQRHGWGNPEKQQKKHNKTN